MCTLLGPYLASQLPSSLYLEYLLNLLVYNDLNHNTVQHIAMNYFAAYLRFFL